MTQPETAILHYTAPPIIGGVETVIQAHARVFLDAGYPVSVVAGRGEGASLPPGARWISMPEMDSQHPEIVHLSGMLEKGEVPRDFGDAVARLEEGLSPVLCQFGNVIIHNIFTKHFNLPLTAALHNLLDEGIMRRCIAWCHDFTWTSPSSRSKVHPGYPWDLLRTYRSGVTYVVVSQERQRALVDLLGCRLDPIRVIYNGVDPDSLLGLSPEGAVLINRLGLLEGDLVLLMPVRVTKAKNIEYALRVTAALKALGHRPRLVVTGPPDPHDARSMAYFQSLHNLRQRLDVDAEVRFVFESGPQPDQPFFIGARVVGDLYRASDVMFMPSHREGFGMPVLEAGLVGLLVVCSDVPAAHEVGGGDVIQIDTTDDPARTADRILKRIQRSPISRLRRRVRQAYSWQAIFRRDIAPLLDSQGNR